MDPEEPLDPRIQVKSVASCGEKPPKRKCQIKLLHVKLKLVGDVASDKNKQ